MTDSIRTFAKNISQGSGGHGLTEDQLYAIFANCTNIEQLAYTFRKCVEHGGKDAFSTQVSNIVKPSFTSFTRWYHVDAKWEASWGFSKTQPGCYIYGLYENNLPTSADFLDEGVIYIGESRAVTRNCMLGRRTDFKGTVKNDRLSPYGCGTAFKENFGKDKIKYVYQAYLPMHPSLCKDTELELLVEYYNKYKRIPVCNPSLDLTRVLKYIEKMEN